MRILYGVQGTGNGHITRARVMAAALAAYPGLEVDFLFSGRRPEHYFDMQPFGHFRCYTGLSFITENGSIALLKTLKNAQLKQFYLDVRNLDLGRYDLLLNDFEPVSAWAAKWQGKPSIGLSHQSAFRYGVPKQGQDLGSKLLMKLFAPCKTHMGVHWHNFGFPILPPIINLEIEHKPTEQNKVLVYLPFESLSSIQAVLTAFTDYRFYIYHPDIQQDQSLGHLQLRQLSRLGFEQDLASSSAVLANGGFELPSEALLLGKKLLIKPLLGQFEQESNAATLKQMNLAATMQSLDQQQIRDWLALPASAPVHYPNVAEALCQWLHNGADAPLTQLSAELWRQVQFPQYAQLPL